MKTELKNKVFGESPGKHVQMNPFTAPSEFNQIQIQENILVFLLIKGKP